MTNAKKLMHKMRVGRVYRRQNLEGFSTTLDRDLSDLVENGEVKKLAGGLYYRPRKNVFGVRPPSEKDLVRAFLKTDNFLLTSYNYFTQLDLGLTQVYNGYVVYNHKRSGEFSLGNKQFEFRVVSDYPQKLSREFLVVDLLNNLKHVPDNSALVRQNLKSRLNEFDQEELHANLERYGRPAARTLLKELNA